MRSAAEARTGAVTRARAESRTDAEWLLRAAALAVLVFALVRALLAGTGDARAPLVVGAAQALDVRTRDSLTALARAGTPVRWRGSVAAVAATSEPVRDPSARTRVLVASDSVVTLADSLGGIDSLAQGGALTTAGLAGAVRVRAQGGVASTEARTVARTGATPGRVLVLGRVGWEAKFTVAALEEAGWSVETRLTLSDTLRITQGTGTALSPRTHAAVVLLDSTLGAEGAAIARFVRAGGGLVLAGDGTAALAALAPARAGREQAGESDAFARDEPRHALPFRVLSALTPDAVLVESRDGVPVIVARRLAAGRVVQVGYAETWRWRMQAERDGVPGHRDFWNDLVASVAAAPSAGPAIAEATTARSIPSHALDESPRASLIHQLGPPSPDASESSSDHRPIPAWLGALALLLLLAEWASRRARGAA